VPRDRNREVSGSCRSVERVPSLIESADRAGGLR
jgi:hypothetical protein